MSTIIDDTARQISDRLRAERERRGWSLGDLAARAEVSKAMLSRIEREEASPTASILVRIASAFGLTLANLLEPSPDHRRLLRAGEQPIWCDPGSGYVRRQVFQGADSPLELIEVVLLAGARVPLPSASYQLIRQVVWALNGRLDIQEGDELSSLGAGDRLEFGPPQDCAFINPGDRSCRYLVAVMRR